MLLTHLLSSKERKRNFSDTTWTVALIRSYIFTGNRLIINLTIIGCNIYCHDHGHHCLSLLLYSWSMLLVVVPFFTLTNFHHVHVPLLIMWRGSPFTNRWRCTQLRRSGAAVRRGAKYRWDSRPARTTDTTISTQSLPPFRLPASPSIPSPPLPAPNIQVTTPRYL